MSEILIIEDDPTLLRGLKDNFAAHGYRVRTAVDGQAGLDAALDDPPQLILLDIMLPKVNGYEVCRRLREWSQIPVIMLSARCDEEDKVKCLDIGADDYLCKPFGLDEMLSRIRAVLRRSGPATTEPTKPNFISDDLEINFVERRIRVAGSEVALTVTEYALLQEFALNSPKVLTYQLLLQRVWGAEYNDERGYLYVFIRRLRRKLERDSQNPAHILSVRDVGYRLV